MKNFKIIAFLFSLLMLMQIASFTIIVKLLSNDQCTEILPDSTDGKSLEDNIDFQSPFITNASQIVSYCLPVNSAIIYIHQSDQIPANYSIDIVNPPPDTI